MLDQTSKNKLLEIHGICRSFPKGSGEELRVLQKVDLTIESGEIVGLLGRSGSGKSTLLRIIGGLIAPSSGDAKCRGETIKGPPNGVSMVFQSFALFPWLTVLQNVKLGLEALGIGSIERRTRALAAIDLIGLDGFESAYPKELSGGMRQRVGFAQALVVHPDLMLMDEPFSALDVLTAETLRTDLIDLWIEGRLPIKSMLMVTHNIEEAVLMCDRILVFSSNPGRVAAEIKVDLPHPRNRLDPTFRQLVDSIYARMTQRAEPRTPALEGIHGTGVGMVLNHVSSHLTTPATWLTGYLPDLPTPFDDSDKIDLIAFAKLCERQIKSGASAIVVAETAGEFSTLTPAEHDTIIRTAIEVAQGRVRVIAGAGSNSTRQAIEVTRRAEAMGADAVLSVVPYYNKPMQAGIYAHFRAIAGSTTLPIILHDIPSRTVRELADDTLVRLAESERFIGLRDGTGDITRPLRLRSLLPHGFRLLSGDDATALAFVANGGDGCISIISNVAPELCLEIYSSCRKGRLESARYLHSRLARLMAALAKDNPAAVKYALCLLGLMPPNTRLPIVELANSAKIEIATAIAQLGDQDLACRSEPAFASAR